MSRPARRVNGSPAAQPALTRCAIYTRKSTEEGLDRDINSLSVQRQACEEYVRSRGGDGWQVAADQYDDGGWSGATIKRPGFQRLLDDVESGQVDCVVVHRVDRLSRSLLDFAQLMRYFQERGVAFVSVTQNFSTADPVGRLTLNLLATFAEFEREMISSRTKDRVVAARRRGKWTGGYVPLGYDVRDCRLTVNEAEADMVRQIFAAYLETLSLARTVEELTRRGVTMKTGPHQNGSERTGRPFDKPSLLRVLRNPLYTGLVRCNGGLASGEHEAIVPNESWQRVQDRLTHNGTAGYQGERENHDALLRGLLHCGTCGSVMTPTYAVKGARRYRYYVCQARLKRGAHACPTGRVAAHEIERRVVEQIRAIGRDPELLAETVRQAHIQLDEKRASLAAERKQLTKDLGRQKTAMKRLLGKASGNGDIAARIQAFEGRLATIDQEIAAAKSASISETDLVNTLANFDGVWGALWPAERSRMLNLLLEGINYDGRDGRIAVRLRPGGIGSLGDVQPT